MKEKSGGTAFQQRAKLAALLFESRVEGGRAKDSWESSPGLASEIITSSSGALSPALQPPSFSFNPLLHPLNAPSSSCILQED